MSTFTNTAREVEMPNGDVVVIHNAPTGGENTTSNIKKFKYDDNGHVTESTAADAEDLNLSSYSTPTTGSTDIGASDDVQTAIGKLDHQSHIDQTNILYVVNTGVKNRLNYNAWETVGVTGGQAVFENNGVTLTASSGDCYTLNSAASFPVDARIYVTEGEVIVLSWDYEKAANANGYAYIFPEGNVSGSKNAEVSARKIEYTVPANVSYITFRVGVNSGSGHVIKYKDIMVCEKVFYDEDQSFLPSALPNYDLTYLQAEDRAALVEEIDSGAKNLIDSPTVTVAGITFAADSDHYITASPNNSDPREYTYANCQWKTHLKKGNYVLAIDIKTATSGNSAVVALLNSSSTIVATINNNQLVNKTGIVYSEFTVTTEGDYGVIMKCYAMVARLMICTKAAFGVSSKFVPYRPNYDLVCDSLFPTSYTPITAATSAVASKISNIIGGYVKIGKLIFINIRFTVTDSITTADLFTVPSAIRPSLVGGQAFGNGSMINVNSNETVPLVITTRDTVTNIGLPVSNTTPATNIGIGTYCISITYLGA